MRSNAWALGIAVVLLSAGTAAFATDAADEPPSKWEFEALPYGWLTGNYGSVTVKSNTVQIDVSPSEVYGLLEDGNAFAAAGYFSAAYDRFSVFTDSMGGYAEERVNATIPTPVGSSLTIRARDKIKFVIADFALGYRLGQWSLPNRNRPFTLGVYAGARYMWFRNELSATARVVGGPQGSGNVVDVFEWADPMIGIRWSLPVLDCVSVDFRGDIGGFGASSDLIWGLLGTTRYWVPWEPFGLHPYLVAGYRAVVFDRSNSLGSIDLAFRGPMAGAGFVF